MRSIGTSVTRYQADLQLAVQCQYSSIVRLRDLTTNGLNMGQGLIYNIGVHSTKTRIYLSSLCVEIGLITAHNRSIGFRCGQ